MVDMRLFGHWDNFEIDKTMLIQPMDTDDVAEFRIAPSNEPSKALMDGFCESVKDALIVYFPLDKSQMAFKFQFDKSATELRLYHNTIKDFKIVEVDFARLNRRMESPICYY